MNKDLIKLNSDSKMANLLKRECKERNKSIQNKNFYKINCNSSLYKKLYKSDSKRPNASQHSSARMIGQFMSGKDVMFIYGSLDTDEDSLYFTVSNNENPLSALGL